MQTIEVIAQGSTVLIGDGIEGKITAVTLRDKNIVYEVTWWDGRIRRVEWLQSQEVREKDRCQKTKIGFNER